MLVYVKEQNKLRNWKVKPAILSKQVTVKSSIIPAGTAVRYTRPCSQTQNL